MSTSYVLTGLHCGACVKRVTDALAPLAQDVEVSLAPMQVTINKPKVDIAELQAAVASVGNYTMQAFTTTAPAITLTSNNKQQSWLATYRPLLLIVFFILGASLLVQLGQQTNSGITWHETMRYFMAGFFLVFAFFKLLDIEAFAMAYAGYDLLAMRWPQWGRIYPFLELALGIAYLGNFYPALTSWLTLLVMGFSAVGVIKAVTSKRQIQCACLGTVFKLPMSTVTIIEDVGMAAMAAVMLFRSAAL